MTQEQKKLLREKLFHLVEDSTHGWDYDIIDYWFDDILKNEIYPLLEEMFEGKGKEEKQ